jgi:hypothetical protein
MVARLKDNVTPKIKDDIGLHQFYICEWDYITVNATTFDTNRLTQLYVDVRNKFIKGLESAKNRGINVQNILKLVDGKNYQKINPTPTPTPTRPVLPPQTDIVKITSLDSQDNLVSVSVLPNVGLWKITERSGSIPTNMQLCGFGANLNSPGFLSTNAQQLNLNVRSTALQFCNAYPAFRNRSGVLPITYDITLEPILSNGQTDTTRTSRVVTFTRNITVP